MAACGGTAPTQPPDAAPPPPPVDASHADAAPPASTTRSEVVTGAGRLQGGRVKMNVQIGHSTDQGSSSGGTVTVEGGAVVK